MTRTIQRIQCIAATQTKQERLVVEEKGRTVKVKERVQSNAYIFLFQRTD
jgi:hypothetical protein